MYTYKAVCTKVIDGDTVELNVDLGFNIHNIIRGRLVGVDAPELFTGEKREAGKKAKEYLEQLVLNKPLTVKTIKDKKSFDRWIVEIRDQNYTNVNYLIEEYCKQLF